MKDPLLQLREDAKERAAAVFDARGCKNTAREIRAEQDASTNAMLAVIDEFRAEHEAVEFGEHHHQDKSGDVYYASSNDPDYADLSKWHGKRVRTFIALVPRAKEQGLVEAAERAVKAWGEERGLDATVIAKRDQTMLSLAAAIKREAEGE
ncbi:MAG: hypothetical protein KOO60_10805 [Gemmatimonadales bacterium]|nr:hypothetical protein [Gemmatimonadales bacterium]